MLLGSFIVCFVIPNYAICSNSDLCFDLLVEVKRSCGNTLEVSGVEELYVSVHG